MRRGPPGRSEERNGRQGGSACRWPQVFHTQGIRLRPMTLFNPVFNCVTPKGIKRSKTQADEGLTPADEAGYVVLRQPPASKLANLFRIDVRDHALSLATQQLGGRVREQPPGGWLGPRTPSLREGPGSASVPSGSPDPVAGTGARVLGNEPSQPWKTGLTTQENECEKGRSLYPKGLRRRWPYRKPLRPFGYRLLNEAASRWADCLPPMEIGRRDRLPVDPRGMVSGGSGSASLS